LTRGGFWEHAVLYQTFPWLFDYWRRLTTKLAGEYAPLLLIAVALVGRALRGWGRRLWAAGRRWPAAHLALPLPVVYAGAAAGSTLLQAGYAEANYNHLLDLFPALCWLVGLGIGDLGFGVDQVGARGPGSAVRAETAASPNALDITPTSATASRQNPKSQIPN